MENLVKMQAVGPIFWGKTCDCVGDANYLYHSPPTFRIRQRNFLYGRQHYLSLESLHTDLALGPNTSLILWCREL